MKNFVQPGNVVTLIAPGDVKSGDLVVVGSLAGVAAYDALAGAEVEVSLVGVFDLPCTGPIEAGAPVYWSEVAAGRCRYRHHVDRCRALGGRRRRNRLPRAPQWRGGRSIRARRARLLLEGEAASPKTESLSPARARFFGNMSGSRKARPQPS